jgi:hypothetical protein
LRRGEDEGFGRGGGIDTPFPKLDFHPLLEAFSRLCEADETRK